MSNMKQIKDGKIRDVDIRLAFMERNLKFFEQPGIEFVNEFGINSTNIVDLAAFDFTREENGIKKPLFYGFEIKSETDNTKRLYNQLNAYISFFQVVYVIAHEKHIEEIEKILDGNKQFDKVGLIRVTKEGDEIKFEELRRARLYKPFYSLFVQNLDLEELRILAAKYNLPLEGSKKVILSRLRKFIKIDQIVEGIQNKVYKYYKWKCPACGSKIYYNKSGRDGLTHVCYKCNYKTYA